MAVAKLDSFLQIGIVDRHKRLLRKLPKEPPEPKSADRDRSRKIQPAYVERACLEAHRIDTCRRADLPKHIDDAHHENKDRDTRKPFCVAFEILLQKNEERERKMQENQRST